jgi:hypothetical protein
VAIPPESIEVGKCYLVTTERGHQVRRVIRIMPDGRVQFERRIRTTGPRPAWMLSLSEGRAFASSVVREVPCDWTPEGDG